jgi:lysozyme family protein
MKNNFDTCFKYLMVDEGGYTNDPADSGGATNYGITIKDYRLYINKNGTPADVKKLTITQAKAIYKSKYWDALGCDSLPSGVDNACFNYGVLAGIGRPKANLKKFANIKDPDKLIDAMCDEMKSFLNRLADRRPKDERFRKGWNNRVDRLRKNSHFLAAQKKDNTSGPLASGVATTSYLTIAQNYINSHPFLVIAGGIAIAAVVWYTVHLIRNKHA